MIRFLERSKKYMTETEENESEEKKGSPIKLNKDGSANTKLRFNVRRMLVEIEGQRTKNQKMFLTKLATWFLVFFWIFVGHFYTALFILWSASVLHKEVISMGQILRKDH